MHYCLRLSDTISPAHIVITSYSIHYTKLYDLTVGGGVGWLTKKYGLTIDNLISLQVVTADGEKIMANESENSDLFWALRGGGGNFGVVTLFEFQLHTVGPEVLAGLFIFPHKQAKQVLRKFHELTVSAPEDLTVISGLRYAPPLPFLPDELVGEKVVILAAGYFGPGEKGMDLIKPLQYFGDALGQMIAPMPYVITSYSIHYTKLYEIEANAQNPIVPPGVYIADPSARVWNDGKLYVYGSLDESTTYYCSYMYHVLSTSDMKNWKLTPDVFNSRGDNDQISYSDKELYAPDCTHRNGLYYLYYCQPDRKAAEGVAVSDSPTA